jgi:hypothetical protein
MRWSIGGRSAATAATANHCGAQLWNPHASQSVKVMAIAISQTGAVVSNPAIARSSARGATPATTVTPTIASDWDRDLSPPSVAVLELALFTTQPTIDGVPLFKWNNAASIGAGFIIPFDPPGIIVKAGAGMVIFTPVAVILQPMDVTFFLQE